METRRGRFIWLGIAILSLGLFLGGCGGGGGTTATGTVSVSLTDAPGLGFDHVWITVNDIWFHTSTDAGETDTHWLKFPLATPVTIDLANLTNGALQQVWGNLALPVGNYQQIRIFLAPTENSLTSSATAQGLSFNNEVDIGAMRYPLRIPTPNQGIRLIGTFLVTTAAPLRLAIDFNAGDDIVKVLRAGATEFILKPRLDYFDLDHAGAITGSLTTPGGVPFANYTGKNFVIKGEQPNAAGTYRVIRRATTIRPDGTFVLYPMPIFGAATTARYDVVIRGRNVETCIVNQVPVHKGTLPASGTNLGSVPLTTGTEYVSNVSASPTGSWMQYYQTIPGDSAPYEIRFRHVNPLSTTGSFFEPLQLSAGPLHVATYHAGGVTGTDFSPVTPVEGAGGFQAAADALLYDRSGYKPITAASPNATIGPLAPTAPATAGSISGTVTMSAGRMNMMTGGGIMFATFGGMIVNTIDVSGVMGTGGIYSMTNLPAGAPYSFFGLYAMGWGPGALGIGAVPGIDMRGGSVTGVVMPMTVF